MRRASRAVIVNVVAISGPCVFVATAILAAEPGLAPNAPKDQPMLVATPDRFEEAVAPYVAEARASYPQAKERFLAGLPNGERFFLTVRLRDRKGNVEQAFVVVRNIHDGVVTGVISSNIGRVEGLRYGDKYTFPESELIDWLITKVDGSEEGNFVGKFIDSQKRR